MTIYLTPNSPQTNYINNYVGNQVVSQTPDHTTYIQSYLNQPYDSDIVLGKGQFNISSTVLMSQAAQRFSGYGILDTILNVTTNNIDGIKVGSTQQSPNIQLNNITIRDMTINLPNNSTGNCINVTGLGEGGALTNIKAQQGAVGFLLEDIDRCIFTNLEAINQNTVSFILRQGFNNTWGTVTFLNCHSVLNTANTIGMQFDNDTVTQLSPNKFDRVNFVNHHFFANAGTAGTVGVKFIVGAQATKFSGCLYENTLRHNDIEAEVDCSWECCSLINVNFGATPTTDGWFLNNFAQISVRDCNLQQMTNLFTGNAGSPRVGLWGINKNNGNITNIFNGSSFGAKFGTDTVMAGDNALASGLNNQQYSFAFTHNLQLGVNGSTITSGSGAPSASATNGDFYFRLDTPGTANQRLYVRSAGAWVGIL